MKPSLRRIARDERTLQFGLHPRRSVMLSGLTPAARRWIDSLDGTRDLAQVLKEAAETGLDEPAARALIEQLTGRGVLHDAAIPPTPLRDMPLAEQDRFGPDLDAMDLASGDPAGGLAALARRRRVRVRVYGAGRVGAQIVALLAASGIGDIRVFDPDPVRARDLVPGGLGWADLGLSRQDGAVAAAHRLIYAPDPTPPPGSNTSPSGVASRPGGDAGAVLAPDSQPETTSTSASDAAPAPRPGAAPTPRPDAAPAPCPGAEVDPSLKAWATPGSRRAVPKSARGKGQAEVAAPAVNVRAGGPWLGDGSQRPDLVILAPVGPLDGVLVNELVALRIPHILVAAFEGHGTVGPLVLPGLTACLHCLDLTRRDRDPDWPLVTAGLGGYPAGEIACDSVLATVMAGSVTGHALAFLAGEDPVVTNGTMDVLPDWHWKRRSWAIHPQCRCMRNDFSSLRMVKSASRA